MTVYLVSGRLTPTNVALLDAYRDSGVDAVQVTARLAVRRVRPGDVVLARLDVAPTLDGVEDGIWELSHLEADGVAVLNTAAALLTAHDKLATTLALGRSGLPHPRTAHVDGGADGVELGYPLVVKPRFGSWGRDVVRCDDPAELRRCLDGLAARGWFRQQGALVQELVPPLGRDLRIVVAGGTVVGAIERHAPAGEWRTNVALGGRRRATVPPEEACVLAVLAAAAAGADLVGVDLLPAPDGSWAVLELNGAVDFTDAYGLGGRNPFDDAVRALEPAPELGVAAAGV